MKKALSLIMALAMVICMCSASFVVFAAGGAVQEPGDIEIDISGNHNKKIPGDFNGDKGVDNEDVIHLLWHTLFPDEYRLSSNGDFTGDGYVTNEDVIHLLWHTLFPEEYPLT